MTMLPTATADLEVHHRTIEVKGLNIFYREAGPADAPADAVDDPAALNRSPNAATAAS